LGNLEREPVLSSPTISAVNALRTKEEGRKCFRGNQGLVATAALQFADGTASTIVTSDAFANYSGYRKNAEAALETLALLAQAVT
jgi:hypothetical protein